MIEAMVVVQWQRPIANGSWFVGKGDDVVGSGIRDLNVGGWHCRGSRNTSSVIGWLLSEPWGVQAEHPRSARTLMRGKPITDCDWLAIEDPYRRHLGIFWELQDGV